MLVNVKANSSTAVPFEYATRKSEDARKGERPDFKIESAHMAEERRSQLDHATYVLYSILADGPIPAKEVHSLALAAGVTTKTRDRAKIQLSIKSDRIGFGKGSYWVWTLPKDNVIAQQYWNRDLD